MNELTDLASPTFASNMAKLQQAVLYGFEEMPAGEAFRQIYFATVYRENFEALALDSDGFFDNPLGIFNYDEWDTAITVATDGIGATFGAVAVPIWYADPIKILNGPPCNNIIVMIGVERLCYRKIAMAVYQEGDQFACTGNWFAAGFESPADKLISPVRRAVVHHG
jgi:hypothetical protein